MRRIVPNDVYLELPCSMVAVGTAMKTTNSAVISGLRSPALEQDGYLSLNEMNRLIRANLRVSKRVNFRRGERPALCDFARDHSGERAVICVYGHYLYFDGHDYHSFLQNDFDPVVAVWYLA